MAKKDTIPKLTTDHVLTCIRGLLKQNKSVALKKLSDITTGTRLETYLDSLDYVELIMEIEKHYSICIPDEQCNHKTIGGIIKTVLKIYNK